jgi:glutamate-1-semialdehyde 2,1-aminomutase
MGLDVDARALQLDALIAKARELPTTRRVLAKQPKTVAENERRRAAGVMMFSDTPGRLSPLVPMIVDRASGCRVHDLDGNEFLDLHMGFWTQILGHAPAVVVEAIKREVERGTNVGIGHDLEIELSEFLIEHIECAEMCSLTTTGTTAVMHSLKVARAARGKKLIAKFGNQFHGHDNDLLVDLNEFKPGIRDSDHTLVLPPTAEAFALIKKHASELAGIIVEPAPPLRDPIAFYDLAFYQELRRVTEEHGIVLIFDEVLRGFRSRFGATLDEQGVIPDLACFGKIIGGGMPVGAVVGRRRFMQAGSTTGNMVRDLTTRVPLMGTYNGNRLACAAGLAQLKHIRANQDSIYPYMREKGAWLGAEINTHATATGLPIKATVMIGSMIMMKAADAHPGPMHPVVLLQTYLRDQGCFFMGGPIQITIAHRPNDLERVSSAIKAAMAGVVEDAG